MQRNILISILVVLQIVIFAGSEVSNAGDNSTENAVKKKTEKLESGSIKRGKPPSNIKDVIKQFMDIHELSEADGDYINENLKASTKKLLKQLKDKTVIHCMHCGKAFEVKGGAADKLRALVACDKHELKCYKLQSERSDYPFSELEFEIHYGIDARFRIKKSEAALSDYKAVYNNAIEHVHAQKRKTAEEKMKKEWSDMMEEAMAEGATEAEWAEMMDEAVDEHEKDNDWAEMMDEAVDEHEKDKERKLARLKKEQEERSKGKWCVAYTRVIVLLYLAGTPGHYYTYSAVREPVPLGRRHNLFSYIKIEASGLTETEAKTLAERLNTIGR